MGRTFDAVRARRRSDGWRDGAAAARAAGAGGWVAAQRAARDQVVARTATTAATATSAETATTAIRPPSTATTAAKPAIDAPSEAASAPPMRRQSGARLTTTKSARAGMAAFFQR